VVIYKLGIFVDSKVKNLIIGAQHKSKLNKTGLILVQFLLGNSPASVCYWPTFRKALSVPSS
jgi:hypothetical protein